MIDRYTLPRLGAIWTQEHRYELWLAVELAVCKAMEDTGKVPRGVADRIKKRSRLIPNESKTSNR